MYKWTPIAGTVMEIGYDNVRSAHRRARQSIQNYAQQWRAGDGICPRPAIRVFATPSRQWDEKWGYGYTGSSSTSYAAKAVSADFNGSSFGRGDGDDGPSVPDGNRW